MPHPAEPPTEADARPLRITPQGEMFAARVQVIHGLVSGGFQTDDEAQDHPIAEGMVDDLVRAVRRAALADAERIVSEVRREMDEGRIEAAPMGTNPARITVEYALGFNFRSTQAVGAIDRALARLREGA